MGLDDRLLPPGRPDRLTGWPLTLSADGRVLASRFIETRSDRGGVAINGVEGPIFDAVGSPALSADGRVCAYRAGRDDKAFVRVNDRDGPPFDFVTDPAVSADGSTVAYAGSRGGAWVLRVNDAETPLPSQPDRVFLGPDGRHVGWVERRPLPEGGFKMRVRFAGSTGAEFGLVGKPVISPTAPLVAYGAEEQGRKFVVVGDRTFETPDRIGDPVFSPDGRRVGYGALVGRELWWKILVH